MKKLLAIFALVGAFVINTNAQETSATDTAAAATPAVTETPAADAAAAAEEPAAEEQSFHQVLKSQFIAGGVAYMWPILICMIIGLAVSIERIITLNLATVNTQKLLAKIEDALAKGGIEAAKEVTKNTR